MVVMTRKPLPSPSSCLSCPCLQRGPLSSSGQAHPFPEITRGFRCLVSTVDFLVHGFHGGFFGAYFWTIFRATSFGKMQKNSTEKSTKQSTIFEKINLDENPLTEISALTSSVSTKRLQLEENLRKCLSHQNLEKRLLQKSEGSF